MVNFKELAQDWLKRLKEILIVVGSFLFVLVSCFASGVVGVLALFAIMAMVFAKMLWPIFVMLALFAGIGLLLGVIVL